MMFGQHHSLYSFDLGDDGGPLPALPHIVPVFLIPTLQDSPQDPIMENINLEQKNLNLPTRTGKRKVNDHIKIDSEDGVFRKELSFQDENRVEVETLWSEAAKQTTRNGLLSWDRLRPTHSTKPSRTAFLSEQDEGVSSAVRYHVQPILRDSKHIVTNVTQPELLSCLRTTVLGISSQLHVWNPNSERFIQVGTENRASTRSLIVDGKDEVLTESFIARFLTIGTLLRRLELLLYSLRSRSAKEGPTIHSLAHSLSMTLDYIRQKLMDCPPDQCHETCLAYIWSCYTPYEELLVALADFCGRSETLGPTGYLHLESDPVQLLSRLYDYLNLHFQRESSHVIRAVMAFMLSNTSSEYIQYLSHSIGFGGQPRPMPSKPNDRRIYDISGDEEEEENIFDLLDDTDTKFANFIPPELLNLLPAAQKSLILLNVAQPDHLLLINDSPVSKMRVRWLWRNEEVEAVWSGRPLPSPAIVSPENGGASLLDPSRASYGPELAFRLFDLEPGIGAVEPLDRSTDGIRTSATSLSSFISTFPTSLPSITPTLNTLASLSFQCLLDHASRLSTDLLHIFTRQPGRLNLHAHLTLLRDFLLVLKPGFKSKLKIALFDDAGEFGVEGSSAHSLTVRAVRKRERERYVLGRKADRQNEGRTEKDKMPWAVGIAYHLLERETWPPVGADMAFYLRTVIVDSLDWNEHGNRYDEEEGVEKEGRLTEATVLEEAEWRLGFAIKDSPLGSEKEKWMDPLSIEALDFLYMDYKPPRPMEVLISPEILSKYQKVFTFILRLLRVDSAIKAVFRMSTTPFGERTALFPTLAKSRRLLLHFRFVAQGFVSGLSGYVFDTAIGGNFDPFLSQLSASTDHGSCHPNNNFSDVFELAQCHSALLNDISTACLLRSGQKGARELLKQSMEAVLEFTVVVGELQRGRIEEYRASLKIEELYERFCVKMTMLTKVLKSLVEKSPASKSKSLEEYYMGGTGQHPTGGLEALYHLLLRLDLAGWWGSRQ